MDFLPEGHSGLDPELKSLVNEQDNKYDKKRLFQNPDLIVSFYPGSF